MPVLDYAVKIAPKHQTTMICKGFQAQLMYTQRLKEIGRPHSLPLGSPLPVYHVDSFPACPKEWIRGSGNYVCPVATDIGLWFNFTMNDADVAVLASVKGMNPITGQKLDALRLERYNETCPKHKIPFQGDRFCPECNYKWPPQSYIAWPNTLWWDGFRQPDGTVRQFFFSSEEERDVASLVIGKENVVPAFGFAFFRTKTPTKRKQISYRSPLYYGGNYGGACGQSVFTCNASHISYKALDSTTSDMSEMDFSCCSPGGSQTIASSSRGIGGQSVNSAVDHGRYRAKRSMSKAVAVGAGAEISQGLKADTLPLDSWGDKPAIMRLYFVFEEQFRKIAEGGILDLEGSKKGFMDGLPVG